ncbi:histidine phosphatase family protein [Microbacterium sp. C7(2022)]|uniref:SixA phosphatase family protein n=1 Tax=Microbacterium sp. C7(2022) TaxID=2992759 RepID=UPI00237A96C7|nr:histidine phosphatase family protein [Microbacterium sp. C7(2022)]MDE0547067.1 histidine phosphatase family protein [Microbacterium sp. C7(2022)]
MIRLALVRHAKSDWGDPALPDHDRPLNARGLSDAPRMAEQFAASGFTPEAILSSTALRARTTAEFFSTALGTPVRLQRRLYGASASDLLRSATESDCRAVMVVAHDPGMTALAAALSRDRIEHMPTCAVATFTWDTDDWAVVDAVDPADWSHHTPR